jgi:hypothetical protein
MTAKILLFPATTKPHAEPVIEGEVIAAELVTPRHILVPVHWGIWGTSYTFAFIGMDGRVYTARSIAGVTVLTTNPNGASQGVASDVGLVELDHDLPPVVIPLFILNPMTQLNLLNGTTIPLYKFGNINTTLSFSALTNYGPGNPNAKGVGMNSFSRSMVSTTGTQLPLRYSAAIVQPTNPQSTNWNDYWPSYFGAPPPAGTGMVMLYDSGSPSLIQAPDPRGFLRLYLMGDVWYTTADSYVPGVLTNLQARIAAYNAAHNTHYVINDSTSPLPRRKILAPIKTIPLLQDNGQN